MKSIPLFLPPNAKVIGALRAPDDLHYLDEDMLSIELSGETFITVGWFPSLNPKGKYVINVFQENFDNTLEDPYFSKKIERVIEVLYSMIAKYSGGRVASRTPSAQESVAVNGDVFHKLIKQTDFVATSSATRSFKVLV